MYRQGETESAGALLYEAAKRCINAVANRNAVNPVKTAAKFHFLLNLSEQNLADFNLLRGWQRASDLHSHADQSHLGDEIFRDAWDTTQAFITEMLAIYDRGQP